MSVENRGDEIWLHSLKGERESLGEGFQIEFSRTTSPSLNMLPLLWLDNRRILTQTQNGKLTVLKTDKTREPLLDIPVGEPPFGGPHLSRDKDSNIVYRCGRSYRIDVEGRRFAPYKWEPLGHGFDCEHEMNRRYGHIIRYQGKEIGRLWCTPREAVTCKGHLALPYGPIGSNLGEPKGVKVWSAFTGKWTAMDLRVNDLVGWMN